MVSQYDCLLPEECLQIQQQLHSLKDKWEPRLGDLPFYTLGAASYLDAGKKGEFFYKMKAKRFNPLLKEHFDSLYQKVAEVLEKETGKPVVYEENYGYPGFHIFLFSEVFEFNIASVHFDLQFQELSWRYKNVDQLHPLSITLPIALPGSGGGMFCWDIHYRDVKELPRSELEKRSQEEEPVLIEYSPGQIVVHEGLFLHQIAPAEEMKENDERITLQGHGLFCDGAWHLYW
ncbi:putative uncharacterized protein [Waddlia chondrophila 2032/99]|uniref:Fe2OG dioxygenase domain-containing protein n=2 Tax=Waddlia chondrophila TaxID=71667 RepID=D6YT59_WADCW|nr:hypothetical protein [Waddlia chondrophila]ADI39254.1 conserved hypothetical protein [Waddlia chondrophila WSU 86-1044]CCB91644.1 putative uncharacterized protein [Waddlia chondrophila 2032/99]